MFARLHKEGWAYDCYRSNWDMENRGASALKSLTSLDCSLRQLDLGLATIPVFLKNIRAATGERWRYVGWDESAHGSHSKIYNWVKVADRRFACENDLNVKIRSQWQEKNDAAEWTIRSDSKKLKDADYIY
jgi:hypothetical protein